jgi:hypothetical protein
MQRPRTRGMAVAGETKRQVAQQSPMRQTAIMACHFTIGALCRRFDFRART